MRGLFIRARCALRKDSKMNSGGKKMKRKNILKKSSRSVLSISMCIIILFGTLIIGGSANASTSNYSHSAAVDYAKKHWNDGVGLCAQFVAACITAGGISVSDKV